MPRKAKLAKPAHLARPENPGEIPPACAKASAGGRCARNDGSLGERSAAAPSLSVTQDAPEGDTGVALETAHRQDAGATRPAPLGRRLTARRKDPGASGAPEGKTTLAGASRERLAKPLADRALWGEFEKATGEPVDPRTPPTWAELIAAQQARRAATSEGGTRDAKELREAAEGSKSDQTRVAFLLSLDGLPRTNAVTGKTPA